ncbi:ABC transporter substrate-binding protein [Gulosibacter molinativorax]|uniref:Peptide ABC transporter n=1 Tax=Gulosibacter molinativorax TaxID=256821 RepID=A0ABT7C5E6_9MICO|nr:ABC transporter substrate-binding protein [Gulosibacter molinativorax]MDJ1370413.1 peptide ABC transporter [Gulosibacter molinativorax]QUY61326.1 Nickel-binding periplasmic protein [Gulosibacter molinativorax]
MTTRARILATLATASVAALALAGCAGGGGGASSGATGEPVQGGSLAFGIPDDMGCVDPQQVSSNDNINIAKQTVASLTAQNPETGEIEPWLAQEWTVSEDATEFTFTLRDGATFSDGTPIDAEAVKLNFEGIVELGSVAPLGGSYLTGLDSITVVDPSTVTIKFSQPSAQFLQATSTHALGLISADSVALSQEERCAGDYIGSGPFVLDSYTPNSGAELSGREDYAWAPAFSENQAAPYLSTLSFTVIPESSTLTGALQSNQIQASANISPLDQTVLSDAGFPLENRANPGVVYMWQPNIDHPIAGDEAVRQAMLHALDRDAIADLMTEADRPATSLLSDSTPNYSDQSDLLTYDPEGAKQTLDDAGWVEGADGIRERDGEKLSFTLDYWQPTTDQLQLMQQQLRAVGIDMQLQQVTVADMFSTINDEGNTGQWANLTRADADALNSILGPNALYKSNRDTPELDEHLAAQATLLDPAERQAEVDATVKAFLEDAVVIPVFQLSTTIVTTPTTHGVNFDGQSRMDFQNAWTE